MGGAVWTRIGEMGRKRRFRGRREDLALEHCLRVRLRHLTEPNSIHAIAVFLYHHVAPCKTPLLYHLKTDSTLHRRRDRLGLRLRPQASLTTPAGKLRVEDYIRPTLSSWGKVRDSRFARATSDRRPDFATKLVVSFTGKRIKLRPRPRGERVKSRISKGTIRGIEEDNTPGRGKLRLRREEGLMVRLFARLTREAGV